MFILICLTRLTVSASRYNFLLKFNASWIMCYGEDSEIKDVISMPFFDLICCHALYT